MHNSLYLLWYSRKTRVIAKGLMALIAFGLILRLSLGYFGVFDDEKKQKSYVPEQQNSFGLVAPVVEVKSLNMGLPNLSTALMNDQQGTLIRYVNAYVQTAAKIVINEDIVVHDQKIEFVNDSDMESGIRTLPWNNGFAVGLSYHGGAVHDPLQLDKLAYGILIKWTGETDPLKASTKLLGTKYPETMRFPMAISHIHQEMLSNIFLVDLEKSSLVDFKSVLLALKDLPINQDQLRKMNHAITHNVSYLTNYLSATQQVADPEVVNKKAFYLLNYYLATDYTLYSMITRRMENTIASNSYREKVRDARKQQELSMRQRTDMEDQKKRRRELANGLRTGGTEPGQSTRDEISELKDMYKR